MSEILSQEEIDALLRGSSGSANENKIELISEEKEALSEICNISINVIAEFLLSKLKKKVTIKTEDLSFIDENDLSEFSVPMLAFSFDLKDNIKDQSYFLYKVEDVRIISDLLIGGDGTQPDDLGGNSSEIMLEVLKEVMPDVVASISEVVQEKITATTPEIFALGEENSNFKDLLESKKMIKVAYNLEIGTIINSKIYQLIPVSMSKKLVNLLIRTMEEESEEESIQEPKAMKKKEKSSRRTEKNNAVTVKPVTFPTFDDDSDSASYDENIDFIMDVPLNISVELGSTSKSIKEILNFNIGSIIELNNLAEDYVDVLVNGKLIARGEVIVIDENFGVRIMELYTNNQRDLLANE